MIAYHSRIVRKTLKKYSSFRQLLTFWLVLICCTFTSAFFCRVYATQISAEEKCCDEIVIEFSKNLVDDDNENRIKEWLSISMQKELASDALQGYQHRQRKQIRALIGTLVVSAPAFTFAMLITMSSDGGTEPILNDHWIVGSIGVAVVNTLVWMPIFIKNKVAKSDAERKMILKYQEFKEVTRLIKSNDYIPPIFTLEF